jgi:hypothetical protein
LGGVCLNSNPAGAHRYGTAASKQVMTHVTNQSPARASALLTPLMFSYRCSAAALDPVKAAARKEVGETCQDP